MKFLNKKVLTSVLLTLMFSVAVSGGCGGGSSGHYSGNFGDSSDSGQDFTTEYVSPDVMLPEPDEPALSYQFTSENDDEYGAIEINSFTLLNKNTWSIDKVAIYDSSNKSCGIRGGGIDNKYNAQKITFLILGNEMKTMAFAIEGAKRTPIYDDLTVLFNTSNDLAWKIAPILRSAEFSKNKNFYQAVINRDNILGTETIEVLEYFKDTPLLAKKILVRNEFTALNGEPYKCELSLSRIDNFSILDQTDWQIKSIDVFENIGKTTQYNKCTVNNFDYSNTLKKLTMYINDEKKSFGFMINDNILTSTPLTVEFEDSVGTRLSAPYLRPASGFQINDKKTVKTCEVFNAVLRNDDIPGEEVLYVSNYAPNSEITIDNACRYRDKRKEIHNCWVRLVLTPYNPNK